MPMQLWQMDVTASLFLADGRECKVITGIDDHSRFCVIAAVVLRATRRAACSAFVEAMRTYGVPAEVLSENGKRFTGRFGRPRPAGVMLSGSGNVSAGDHVISAGLPLAGQRVTLRLDGPVAHILSGGTWVRSVTCPAQARARLRGARGGTAQSPRLPEPLTVKRRASVRGAIMIGGQRIQVGLPHAGKTADVTIDADTYQITVENAITLAAPRTTSRDIKRHKASNYRPAR